MRGKDDGWGMLMRITLNLDDDLMAKAMSLSGITDTTQVLHEALRSRIGREASRRLATLGRTAPKATAGRRRRSVRSGEREA